MSYSSLYTQYIISTPPCMFVELMITCIVRRNSSKESAQACDTCSRMLMLNYGLNHFEGSPQLEVTFPKSEWLLDHESCEFTEK